MRPHYRYMTTQQIDYTQKNTIDTVAGLIVRYGLVIVLAWYGGLKFMTYEAEGIVPLVSDSPFMSWVYDVFSVYTFSALLGVFEIARRRIARGKALVAQGVRRRQPARHRPLRLDDKFHVHHHRGIRGCTGRIPGALADRWLPDERYCAAGNLRVDPGRRRAGTASLA